MVVDEFKVQIEFRLLKSVSVPGGLRVFYALWVNGTLSIETAFIPDDPGDGGGEELPLAA